MNEQQHRSLGRIAFEAGARALSPLTERSPDAWDRLQDWERAYWEAIAAAVASEARERLARADAALRARIESEEP